MRLVFVLALILTAFSGLTAASNSVAPILDLGARVQPIPQSARFGEPGFFVWCGAPVKGDDGKYHLLYSRWPVSVGFAPGWALRSEVAYAVSDSPFGPFRHVNVALSARGINPATGRKYWDADATHNPNLLRHPNGKYYLYYMGNYGDGKDYPTHRNHQRIGLAVADSPAGPWKRFDQPIVDISPDPKAFDSLCVTNPAATVRPDGGIVLLYKAVSQAPGKPMGGKVRYGAVLASSPGGPYVKTPGRIFEAENPGASAHWMLAEDPFIWFSKTYGNRYYAVARDVVGHFTGEGGGIAMFQSEDGLNWRAADHPKVIGQSYAFADGTRSITKLERPAVLFEGDEPVALFGAADGYKIKGRISTNVAIPLTSPASPAMSSSPCPAASSTPVPDASKWLHPLREKSIFSDPIYNIWCGSVVSGDDGKYHMFYSRWPRALGHNAWVTHSEIARAVSDSPYGPFKHADIVLPERDVKYWDGKCTHNPTVLRIGKKYYLYYMANTGDRAKAQWLNWQHRNSQRIGVAVADSPSGPWTRFDHPVLDVSLDPAAPDSLAVNNPSVAIRPDGGVLMLYKAIGRAKPLPFGGPVVHLTATADNPLGPFTKQLRPVLTDPRTSFPAEDPFMWHDGTRYLAIVKDMGGHFTGVNPSLALFSSEDGLSDWKPAPQPLVSGLSLTRADGSTWSLKKLERPQLWFRDGKPAILYCAAADKPDLDGSVNVAIPLVVP